MTFRTCLFVWYIHALAHRNCVLHLCPITLIGARFAFTLIAPLTPVPVRTANSQPNSIPPTPPTRADYSRCASNEINAHSLNRRRPLPTWGKNNTVIHRLIRRARVLACNRFNLSECACAQNCAFRVSRVSGLLAPLSNIYDRTD